MIVLGANKLKTQIAESLDGDKTRIRAPRLWAHRRAMQDWKAMNAVDQETFHAVMAQLPKGVGDWVASWTDSEVSYFRTLYPEIFKSNESMAKFLRSPEGRAYAVPGRQKRFT